MKHLVLSFSTIFFLTVSTTLVEDRVVLKTTGNPQPDTLPTLGIWQEHHKKRDIYYTNVSAVFPNIPGFTCDLWYYESPGINYLSARERQGGTVGLRHNWDDHPWHIITMVTPLEQANVT